MSSQTSLRHLAVIMDGNGRWAEQRQHKRLFGHVQGAKQARSIIKYCSQKKIPVLSLFALSIENNLRPKTEVKILQKLLEKIFLKHFSLLMEERIRLNIVGDLSLFPSSLQKICQQLVDKTKHHEGLNLIVALNYGGQQEILEAIRSISEKVRKGLFLPEDINKSLFDSYLPSSAFPPPDLIIRTGGVSRISNFYLWSISYSEFYFTKTLWPDFTEECLYKALQKFTKTKRRFGML